ncbi:hypothetical protein EBT16_06685 [bacterium]|nr:hypothetical protein [bacterium]
MEGMTELAEFTFELPVRRGAPNHLSGLVDVVSSPLYSTAVGLLMYGMKNQMGVQVRTHELGTVYEKMLTKMKGWLGEVF